MDTFSTLDSLARDEYCYLTTQGRKSGKAHTVELWFALQSETMTVYILSGGRERADWVKNIVADPYSRVRIAGTTFLGNGRVVSGPDEDRTAREMVVRKYYHRAYNPSGGWEADSLPVAIDILAREG